jgi:type II secretory pathway predicted ATPase ExeA
MGLAPKATAAAVFHELNAHVQQLHRERTHPAFLLDEAHLLHQDVLDHLHILANYEWDAKALLSLVLVGLPELWERMMLKRNRSLWSRIHCRLSLGEPDPGDTAEYVRHRTTLAGAQRSVFATDALAVLHEHSAGRLRDIDRVATDALKRAARAGSDIVDRDLVVAAINAEGAP